MNNAQRAAARDQKSWASWRDDHSQINNLSLDSPKLYEFYETVMELDVPIFVHPALVPNRLRTPEGV